MKNDESTKDLVLFKKLTSFQKLTGLFNDHHLICKQSHPTII